MTASTLQGPKMPTTLLMMNENLSTIDNRYTNKYKKIVGPLQEAKSLAYCLLSTKQTLYDPIISKKITQNKYT